MIKDNVIHIRDKEESSLCSGLYLISTPIGNLRDITLRALDVLNACDFLVCEDSRVTGKLFKAYGLPSKKKIVYNDYADDAVKNHIISLVKNNNIVAFVSDAGTPMISDPGYKLVRACVKEGIYVTALPGANAILPALQLSGLPSDKFIFCGFLPSKDKAVRDVLARYQAVAETLIFYDSPKRIEKDLEILLDVFGDRNISVCREISKLYEESLRGSVTSVLHQIKQSPLRGEIVLVIEGVTQAHPLAGEDLDEMILSALREGQSLKDLSVSVAIRLGIKKKDVYDRALVLRQN